MRIINDPNVKQALIDGQPYDVTITVTPVGGSPVAIDLDHVAENGISINPSSVSGNRLELGTVIAAAATFTFYNYDGSLDGINFKGAEIHVEGSVSVPGTVPRAGSALADSATIGAGVSGTFDIGYFIADEVKVQNRRITVNCLDRMILMDKEANISLLSFPNTISFIFYYCCALCGLTWADSYDLLPNAQQTIDAPDGNPTYRQLVGWCAAAMGRCAKINNEGKVELCWYADAAWDMAMQNRFDGGEIADDSVTTTGVKAQVGNNTYLEGADGYTIDIVNNPFFTDTNAATMLSNILADIGSVTYYTASCAVINNVLAEPFDIVNWEMPNGTARTIAVTDVVYNLSAKTSIQSKGQSEEEAGYAQQNPFTPSQAAAVADAGRLKVGRIESVDETIYYDLDTGEIHTEITKDRALNVNTTYPYNTALDFTDGQLEVTTKKSGTEIEKIKIGVDGINIDMDSSQPFTYPIPANWSSMTAVAKAVYLTAQRLLDDPWGVSGRLVGGITIRENPSANEIKQLFEWSGGITDVYFDTSANLGYRTQITPGEIDVQKVSYSGNPTYDVDNQTKITPTLVSTDKIAAATGIKIGSDDYNDPAAKAVATENYVQSYVSSLLGDYVTAAGYTESWNWRQWHSGKIECWRSVPITVPANGFVLGTSLYHYDTEAVMPTNMFSQTPFVQLTARASGGYAYWIGSDGASSTVSSSKFRLYREAALGSSATFYVHAYAYGVVSSNWSP